MKNIVVLADFPPVIGGTTIWYYRVCELLLKRGYRIGTLGGKGSPPAGVSNLNPPRRGNALLRMWYFLRDACTECVRQRGEIGDLLGRRAIQLKDVPKLISYLVLIRRTIAAIPREEGIVLASHANMNSVLGYLLCRRHGALKLVIRTHGACVLELAQRNPNLVRFVLNKASSVNCVSAYIAGIAVQRGSSPEKTTVIHSARDIPAPDAAIVKQNRVIFCGFLDPRKDPMTFLKAIREVVTAKRLNGVRYSLIGDGTLKAQVQAYCHEHGLQDIVEMTGALPLKEVWAHMAKSKVLVLPSVREPSGAVLTEAIAHRCYCIASRVGGIPELVTPQHGTLFEPGDYQALADAIEAFFANETAFQSKIEAAHAYVREHYSFERAVSELERSFERIT